MSGEAACGRRAEQSLDPPESLGEPSDEQLLAQYQQGSQWAFRQLYARHYHKARALALSLTRDENDASEVVQEAFIRVLRKWSHFEGHSAFYTWLYRIVFNLAVDRLRRPFRKPLPVEDIDHLLAELPLPRMLGMHTSDPFENCVAAQASRSIAEAMQCLSRPHRDVIVMRELHGMSYSEMAHAMGCSKGTIMSRLFHARQRLQGLLRWLHDEPPDTSCLPLPSMRALREVVPRAGGA